ncbi:PhzA/PhzB family protein [Homoserinimonas sp. OAct 916]|uniref:PhzA/PhzB family protein n=1 Tax=Homoserinimonas sp. OAct 916 TaxID=2211450 RepID=UPI001300846B|nr:PhzA/PhzB family protein [Homoserinimonas sp. OAct 916]
MKTAPERYSFSHNVELRAHNKEVVTNWFSDHFAAVPKAGDAADRYQPYVRYQRNFLPEGRREYTGIDSVTAQLHAESGRVTDWEWTDLEILTTEYPQVVWVLAESSYRLAETGKSSGNSYAFAFVLENGKIRLIKEWLNPLPLLEERGVTVPNSKDI